MTERGDKSAEAFRTISEVANELNLATHVLRFWESKFPQIKPLKRAGGRRYYRPDDVALLRRLQVLLHDEGYTIKGVQKLFREEGARKFIDEGAVQAEQADETVTSKLVIPQANLFDTTPTNEQAQSFSPVPESSPRLSFPSSASNILPNAPEPEEILDPLVPIPEPEHAVIKQGLSDNQKEILNAIIVELQDMKNCLDEVA